MLIDLQLSAEPVLRNVRDELRRHPLCLTKEFQLNRQTVLLDNLEITDKTTMRRIEWLDTRVVGPDGHWHQVPGSAVEITQEVLLHLVTVGALQGNAENPTPPSSEPLYNPSI